MINYDSPSSIKKYLDEHNLSAQKKFGQNFLISAQARQTLVKELGFMPDDTVWEIGPGLGAVTSLLLEAKARVSAFEIDHGFCAALTELFSDKENFTLVEGDFLKTFRQQKTPPDFILGNLPYNIAATLIGDLIETGFYFKRAVFTVQKEVALRMCAKAGTHDYSSLSILCTSRYDVKQICKLSGSQFYPPPNVDSACVLFQQLPAGKQKEIPPFFYKFVRTLFANRRKTVQNNLAVFLTQNAEFNTKNQPSKAAAEHILNMANIKITERAERLTLDDFLRITDNI
ncbi:MAG: 16S rRNA (adenine(1518)-N(6)/adenine(1519)-N(6))-dimethyltransferase RsmA [Spirochaetaceae bacterium]|jgi:16S rRNA (adenine1518-N6/adenine1519-N6)-dimethyltransferase|nr:16S rRNA (adenine(1518)-N(6)/adenine(1519)-N(6))-dimethyltransferase RsmA [Spirochaetaceae bacterium]